MGCIEYLQKEIHENMQLADLVDIFEKASNKYKNQQDMLLFETGIYSFTKTPMFYFSIVKQFPNEEEEFCQVHLDVMYSTDMVDKDYSESVWDEDIEEDFFWYIRNSEIYTRLKDKEISNIDIYADET